MALHHKDFGQISCSSELEGELATLLGDSKKACCTIIKSVDEKLPDIEKESGDLGAIIDAGNAVRTHLLPLEARWLTRRPRDHRQRGLEIKFGVGKKLKHSFSESRLDQSIRDRLRHIVRPKLMCCRLVRQAHSRPMLGKPTATAKVIGSLGRRPGKSMMLWVEPAHSSLSIQAHFC